MEFQIRRNGAVEIQVQIDGSFFPWLQSRIQNPVIQLFDPWQISTLEPAVQEIWLRELRMLMDAIRAEAQQQFTKGTRLPKNPEMREQLLSDLVEKYLDQHHSDWQAIKDLQALLELAISSDSTIYCIGD